MNILSKLTTVSALALLSLAAQADTICNKCAYVTPARYLGGHWPADRSTFAHDNVTRADNYWVFDLNDNAVVTLTAIAIQTTGPFGFEIYADTGSTCDALRCTVSDPDFNNPLVSMQVAKRWNAKATLVPGRYLIRFASDVRVSYTGMLRVRVLQGWQSAAARQGNSPQRW
jgi:hypothetical protein